MALFKFTKAILNNDPIDVYNNGEMSRDFTYIDDLINGLYLLVEAIPERKLEFSKSLISKDSLSPVAPFRVVNIGNSKPIKLTDFIYALEEALGISAHKNLMPMQAGDVPSTWADTSLFFQLTGYNGQTNLEVGVKNFVNWYTDYYQA